MRLVAVWVFAQVESQRAGGLEGLIAVDAYQALGFGVETLLERDDDALQLVATFSVAGKINTRKGNETKGERRRTECSWKSSPHWRDPKQHRSRPARKTALDGNYESQTARPELLQSFHHHSSDWKVWLASLVGFPNHSTKTLTCSISTYRLAGALAQNLTPYKYGSSVLSAAK